MTGIYPSSTLRGTNINVESGSSYPLGIDAALNALLRTGGMWAPRAQVTPDMTMRVDPGAILSGTTETEVGGILQGTVTNGSANITNVSLTDGVAQGMVLQAYAFVAGVLTQLFPEATTLLNAPTTGALNAASLTASANANGGYTGTAIIILSQGVGLASFSAVTSNGSPIVTTIPAGVTANLLVGMAFTGPGVTLGAGLFVLSIDSSTQIHLTGNAGAGAGAGTCCCDRPDPGRQPAL